MPRSAQLLAARAVAAAGHHRLRRYLVAHGAAQTTARSDCIAHITFLASFMSDERHRLEARLP